MLATSGASVAINIDIVDELDTTDAIIVSTSWIEVDASISVMSESKLKESLVPVAEIAGSVSVIGRTEAMIEPSERRLEENADGSCSVTEDKRPFVFAPDVRMITVSPGEGVESTVSPPTIAVGNVVPSSEMWIIVVGCGDELLRSMATVESSAVIVGIDIEGSITGSVRVSVD